MMLLEEKSGITKVTEIHSLGTMNVYFKFSWRFMK